MMNKNI